MLSSIQGLFGKRNSKSETPAEKADISVRSPEEIKDLEKLIMIGPVTFVFVHADWCGHCQTYKPTWEELEGIPGRTANMAAIHHDMVEKSPMLKNAKIPGYPSVLKVYPNGSIEKYKGDTNALPNIRDKETMMKELTALTPVTASIIQGKAPEAPGSRPTGYAASMNTRRNLNNTRIVVQNTLAPTKNSVSIGASTPPRILEPMKGGNLYAALTRALVQAGPASLLLVASQSLPPKKGRGSTKRLTRKANTRKTRSASKRSKSRKN
jgi:thiol-disulfide isomerase/thioredoxin